MNQVWVVVASEEDAIIMNIMTSNQRNDYVAEAMKWGSKIRIVIQYQIGCTDIRICNMTPVGEVRNPNYFERLMIGTDTYRVGDKGSLEYEEREEGVV